MKHYCLRENSSMICRRTLPADSAMFGGSELARLVNGYPDGLHFVEYNPEFETPAIGEVFRTVAEKLKDTRDELAAGRAQ